MTPFLSIIGIGEDGVEGLSATARRLIGEARLVMGGARHLALAEALISGERAMWPSPIGDAAERLAAMRPSVALASGDPFCFGVGPLLAARMAPGSWRCLPAPSCLSLACARLGWALQDCAVISFCARPMAPLVGLLQPGARVLALSEDADTPASVAAFLCARGFGGSEIVVMEALGGSRERVRRCTADAFVAGDIDRLNLLAITVLTGAEARPLALSAGLADDLFEHDGQITKREIRAATMAALAPLRGELLWDVGTGSGSVAIEWMQRHTANTAIGIDRRADRLARARRNAERLGVPSLRLVEAHVPEGLAGLPVPDAVFIGGGAQSGGVIEACWAALRPGRRIVANSVTIETDALLHRAFSQYGGTLTRIGVERLDAIGDMHGFRPTMTVMQWAARK